MKKHIGIVIAEFARSEKISQTQLSDLAGISYPQLNKFFNGRSNLSLEHFLSLLKILKIDLLDMLQSKLENDPTKSDEKIHTPKDCLIYLYNNLDKVRQQATLKQLEMAVILSNKKLPKEVQYIVKKSTRLI